MFLLFEQTYKHAKELGKKGLPHEELYAQMFQRDLADGGMAYGSRCVGRPTRRRLSRDASGSPEDISSGGDELSDTMEVSGRHTSPACTWPSVNNRGKSIRKSRRKSRSSGKSSGKNYELIARFLNVFEKHKTFDLGNNSSQDDQIQKCMQILNGMDLSPDLYTLAVAHLTQTPTSRTAFIYMREDMRMHWLTVMIRQPPPSPQNYHHTTHVGQGYRTPPNHGYPTPSTFIYQTPPPYYPQPPPE